MKKYVLVVFMLMPILTFSQELTERSNLMVTKTWSQVPNGYTYPIGIHVPVINAPENGFPVCILLHGNQGNGFALLASFENILPDHVLVAPTGYANTWNLCAEESEAPDVDMVNDLVILLQGYSNIDSDHIRILGISNGAGLANNVFIGNSNAGIDIVCAIVTQLNMPQHHSNGFYLPSNTFTNPANTNCGYDVRVDPLTTRRYLSICNTNDPIIPYTGGESVVGVDFLHAEEAAYVIAKNQGYTGNQHTGSGTSIGDPEVSEFSYLSGKVVLLVGDAGHSTNSTQMDYVTEFFSDVSVLAGVSGETSRELHVYPNPASTEVTFERRSIKASPYWVFNTLGQQVLRGIAVTRKTQVDLTGLPAQVYFLKIDDHTVKLIKQH